jgi:hypothetical protein
MLLQWQDQGNAYSGSSSEERYAIANATNRDHIKWFCILFWLNSANTVDPATAGKEERKEF